jgi:hypothetical protein
MANVVSSSPILVIVMMEATVSSETSVLTRNTLCNIPEDSVLQGIDAFHIAYDFCRKHCLITLIHLHVMSKPILFLLDVFRYGH